MGIIREYVTWEGHDACGALPPLTVCAGVVDAHTETRGEVSPGPNETLVFVPPQWLGDWETGRPLPPGYQYLWVARTSALRPAVGDPPCPSYAPAELPATARGLSPRRPAWRPRPVRRGSASS